MNLVTKNQILDFIKERKISPEVGFQLLKCELSSYTENKEKQRNKQYADDEIAVVGMSGVFPGASNVEEFWELLKNGKSMITDIPRERWNWDEWKKNNGFVEDIPQSIQRGGFLKDLDKFDAEFFQISKNEAKYMDPCQRLFIQESWKALEDAGYTETGLYEKQCGVFVGCQETDYLKYYSGAVTPFVSTGSSKSVLASRVSYFLNLKGPAVSIDTACSSALSALHIACQSIKDSTCEIALAGGVLTMSSPAMFTGLASLNMFSKSGTCSPFDEHADGTLIGEAVGVVVLKRLSDAVKDGNHIYGIIKATGWNQDGKTSGITAPSAVSQTALEESVYRRSGINPESISYIETHGTGTKLGDPIEIQALTDAFGKFTNKKQYCAIGSVKANIGHTMPAAGIVSLIKVLCCMEHKQLVPSVNFTQENHLIDFKRSPFYVNNKLIDWNREKEEPLRAAISSFGFSGTNCHVIVEEYIEESPSNEIIQESYYLMPFSARSKNVLERKIEEFIEWLECEENQKVSAHDLSYTLCMGRSHFKYRLCCVVKSLPELHQMLGNYRKGIKNPCMFEYGERERKTPLQEENAKYMEVAEKYVQREIHDFAKCFKKKMGKIVKIPFYPFTQNRYWIYDSVQEVEKNAIVSEEKASDAFGFHTEQKTEDGVQLQIELSLDEYYAKNHIVNGRRVLPGAMQMVMAAAGGEKENKRTVKKITDVVWLSPVELEKNRELFLELKAGKAEERYRVWNGHDFSQGTLHYASNEPETSVFQVQELIGHFEKSYTDRECYEYFESRGLDYGEGFHTIQKLYSSSDEALAVLEVPDFIMENSAFVNCSMIDAAFQSVMGIVGDGIQKNQYVNVPFLLEKIRFLKPLEKQCYVYAKQVYLSKNGAIKKYDLHLINKDGSVAIEIRNFSLKGLLPKQEDELQLQNGDLLYVKREWKETVNAERPVNKSENYLFILNDENRKSDITKECEAQEIEYECILSEQASSFLKKSQKRYDYVVFVSDTNSFQMDKKQLKRDLEASILTVYEALQDILRRKKPCRILYCIMQSPDVANPLYYALDAVVNTLNGESIKSKMKLLFLEQKTEQACRLMLRELLDIDETCIWYQNGKRMCAVLTEDDTEIKAGAFVDNGVYVITGGSGQIGRKIADYLAETYGAQVFLIGRSSSQEIQDIARKQKIIYVQGDISNRQEIDRIFWEIEQKSNGKKVNGILHCAGVLEDSFMIKKSMENIHKVIKPKVDGTILLYQKVCKEGIHKLVLFSSIASVFGNIGQADYAYANSFMNHFSEMVKTSGVQVMSLCWPFWENGGMSANKENQKATRENIGLYPMPTDKGIEALEHVMCRGEANTIVLYGEKEKIKNMLHIEPNEVCMKSEKSNVMEKVDDKMDMEEIIRERLLKELMEIAGEFVTGCEEKMGSEDDIQDYGFDSVTITAFCNTVNERLGVKLSPASFFELDEPTISALRDFMMGLYEAQITELYGQMIRSAQVELKKEETRQERNAEPEQEESTQKNGWNNKVAIIGMNAVMPQCEDIQEYFKSLLENKELIADIPEDREVYLKDVHSARRAGFMKEIDKFDPEFFHMSPREAGNLDPQVRIILELIWKTFEDAGYDPKEFIGKKVGVFLGISSSDYCDLLIKSEVTMDASVTLGISNSLRANRISFAYDFRGPSEPIDTACSSSLIAIHHGVEALNTGTCDVALAAGVNVMLTPTLFNSFDSAGMLSKEGKSKTFDSLADGYVRGEGAGVILLKPLSIAEYDKDDIYAVICSSTENHGGRAKSITSPNANAQAQLIFDAYKKVGIHPEQVSYIETHGTGTQIGDIVEINGLKKAFKNLFEEYQITNPKKNYCGLGAVKPNIGHLEAASGIASVMKVVMALKNQVIPATIHFQKLNPYIELEDSPFYIVSENKKWDRMKDENGKEIPRIAGVSAFGYGGSNAHLVLEEYQKAPEEIAKPKEHLFVFSAKNEESLKMYIDSFLSYLEPYCRREKRNEDGNEVMELIARNISVSREELSENASLSEYCNDQVILSMIADDIRERYRKEIDIRRLGEFSSIADIVSFCSQEDCQKENFAHEILNLDKVEYVLKCGRNHMDIRIAVVAEQCEQLYQCLKDYGEGKQNAVYIKGCKADVTSSKLVKEAVQYVNGASMDWKKECEGENIGRIHIPTYCFAKERCWFENKPSIKNVSQSKREEPKQTYNQRKLQLVTQKKTATESKTEIKQNSVVVAEEKPIIATRKPVKKQQEVRKRLDVELIKSEIKELIAEVLYVDTDKVSDTKVFMELGLDSILGVELVRKLKDKYQVDIKATKIYDYSNINRLSEYVAEIMSKDESEVKNEQEEFLEETTEEIEVQAPYMAENDAVKENQEIPKYVQLAQSTSGNWKDIAVIGMSARMPQAENIEEMWERLKNGDNCVSEIPSYRWNYKDFETDPDMYCKWGGFVKDVDKFDPLFFNLSPADAEVIDPQQRIFVMEVWKALENAGYSNVKLDHKNCGIYAGVMTHSEYSDSMFNAHSMLAARAAYFLNLKGPALSIDTACSSSLVATHLACRSLIDGDADMMVVGGVTLYLSPRTYKGMGAAGMLSKEGRCKTFDDSADGFVPGEGVSVVVLKLLENAVRDGDHIYGVIKGSGINQDGKTNGITAPSALSQMDLECHVYEKFGIDPEKISYVECHGTGTKLGDPIEIEALRDAFRKYTKKKQYCRIGSMKSNFGHTSAASGVGSLIKVLLSMQNEIIPPTIHFEKENEHIDFKNSPFIVNVEAVPWKSEGKKCAAVSAFGYSGTNAHLVVEEYKEEKKEVSSREDRMYLFPISARNEKTAEKRVKELRDWLEQHGTKTAVKDISYTLTEGRSHFDYRICFAARNVEELKKEMDCRLNRQKSKFVLESAGIDRGYSYMVKQLQKFIVSNIKNMPYDSKEYSDAVLAFADMYVRGNEVEWAVLYGARFGKIISIPAYPFDLKSYWVEAKHVASISVKQEQQTSDNPLCGTVSQTDSSRFSLRMNKEEFFIRDNEVYGRKIVPGVAYLEIVKASLERAGRGIVTQIKNLYWIDMVDVNSGEKEVVLKVKENDSAGEFIITSENGEKTNAQGFYSYDSGLIEQLKNKVVDVKAVIEQSTSCVEGKSCYEGYKNRLFIIGSSLQSMEKMYFTDQQVLSILKLPANVPDIHTFKLHPSIMDAVLQTATGLQANMEVSPLGKPYISFCIGEVLFVRPVTEICYAFATLSSEQSQNPKFRNFDVELLDQQGKVIVAIRQFGIKQPLNDWDQLEVETSQETVMEELSEEECQKMFRVQVDSEVRQLLKMTEEEIVPEEELLNYGFSSITLIQFTNKINQIFGLGADMEIFFNDEVITLQSITQSLYGKYKQEIRRFYEVDRKSVKKYVEPAIQEKAQVSVSMKQIYDEVLEAVVKQFRKANMVQGGKLNLEAVSSLENFIAEQYHIPLEKCKITNTSSLASMVKEVISGNKELFKNR